MATIEWTTLSSGTPVLGDKLIWRDISETPDQLKESEFTAVQTLFLGDGLTGSTLGFRQIPQNSQSDNYTCAAADSGKHIYQTGASKTVTIPANASVAFPIGTAITFVCANASGMTIAITSDTLRWAEDGSTGSVSLAQYGIATAVKVTSTEWLISGTGLS